MKLPHNTAHGFPQKESCSSAGGDKTQSVSCPGLSTSRNELQMLDHMKSEIRKLYGEKVNMVNTNYILKPHEFKCLSKALTKALWGEERKLETVDDLLYAVDALCTRAGSATQPGETECTTSIAEAGISIRYVASALKTLISSENSPALKSATLTDDLKALSSVEEVFRKRLEASGYNTLESLIAEKERLQKMLQSITEKFSIPLGENIVTVISHLKEVEERRYAEELILKEKSIECQKRHFEGVVARLKESLQEAEAGKRTMERLLKEKEENTQELERSSTCLESSILEIKKAIEEEKQVFLMEKREYSEIKQALLEQNKRMSQVVQELVLRIKKEQKEKEELMEMKTSEVSIQ
ncbi:hypothetical protein NEFER03_1056 [Nematocida sp. LUAm3]|nr:hypothetical protein NEFER03_1056 [Nematocida sp. LUAm3]KAI5175339.1 hypothetical protein NEFER02_1268 [Nematocida sp. LUAm2]KAI5177704.1 hypothetical protein NEFER01_0928 [Nematocida sp. LUAm1]